MMVFGPDGRRFKGVTRRKARLSKPFMAQLSWGGKNRHLGHVLKA